MQTVDFSACQATAGATTVERSLSGHAPAVRTGRYYPYLGGWGVSEHWEYSTGAYRPYTYGTGAYMSPSIGANHLQQPITLPTSERSQSLSCERVSVQRARRLRQSIAAQATSPPRSGRLESASASASSQSIGTTPPALAVSRSASASASSQSIGTSSQPRTSFTAVVWSPLCSILS